MNIDRSPFANQTASVPSLWHYATGTFSLLCLLCGLCSNGLVIFVFLRNINLRRPRNYLLINLAVTDLGLLLTNNTFHTIASYNTRWLFGNLGCDLYGFCGGVFGLTSIATMVAISFTRLAAVINPFSSLRLTRFFIMSSSSSSESHRPTSRFSLLECIVCSWLYGVVWIIPPLVGWSRFIFEGFGTTCTFDYMSQALEDRLYMLILVVGGFLIPLMLILASYTFILIKLSKRSRHLTNNDNRNYELRLRPQNLCYFHPVHSFNDIQSRSGSTVEWSENNQINQNLHRTEARAARTALLVCAIYCTAWGPYAFMAILSNFGFTYIHNVYSTAILSLCTKLAACINPLIYAISSSSFRRQICLFVTFIIPCRERSPSLPTPNSDGNRKN